MKFQIEIVPNLLQRAMEDANGSAVAPRRHRTPATHGVNWREREHALAGRASEEGDGVHVQRRKKRGDDGWENVLKLR